MHPVPPHGHSVKFYASQASLFQTVGEFLGRGLRDGHPALMIATAAHSRGILDELERRALRDCSPAARGELLILDADQVLASFVSGNVVDRAAFERTVGSTVRLLVHKHRGTGVVRAYGEMVDVLWKQERRDAAIRLEVLWNDLARRCSFSLLCGYAIGSFYRETQRFEQVCAQHTHVLPADDGSGVVPPS
jgi:hypothetical protein